MLPKKQNRRRGQSLVEYALSVLVVIMVFGIMNRSILKGIGSLWKTLSIEIAAACPDCRPPESLQQ